MASVRIFQKGFNFSQDGPGNRLVYHLQGCQLHCPWCSNPEGLPLAGGTAYPVETLVSEALRSRAVLFDGGGVTLTGGEATLQFDAVKELLERLKAAGIHTALETNGLSPRLCELFDRLDCLLLDCKHHDPERHRAVTGLSNRQTVENLRLAVQAQMPVAIRIPLIGGFNTGAQHAERFAKLFTKQGAQGVASVELLPYHAYGKYKYEKLGIPYAMTEEARAPESIRLEMEQIFRERGFLVVRT